MVFYLESWFSWLWGGIQKTLKKRRKQTRKTLKSEEKEKRRMREKSNNSTVHLLVLNYILLENIFLKKVVYSFIP